MVTKKQAYEANLIIRISKIMRSFSFYLFYNNMLNIVANTNPDMISKGLWIPAMILVTPIMMASTNNTQPSV